MAVKKSTAKVLSKVDARVLEKYLKDISVYPRLSAEEEREYGQVVQNAGASDDERSRAADALVNGNLHFVVPYAKRRSRTTDVSLLDLINEGNLGLMLAARRFDPERGVRFIFYAVWWIRQAINYSIHHSRRRARISRLREALAKKLGRAPSIEEIAKAAKVPAEEVEGALYEDALARENAAEALVEAFGSNQERPIQDLLVQTTFVAADEELVRRSSEEQTRALLDNLPAKERAVLCRRFGISEDEDSEREPMTLQEIGDELKLSRDRVRQIEAQALARIRRTINQRKLHGPLE